MAAPWQSAQRQSRLGLDLRPQRAAAHNGQSYVDDDIQTAIWARELRPSLFMMLLT
jgi:hypothetical protein